MSVLINNKVYNAEYLHKPEEMEKGMMGREELDGCMVFNKGKGYHSFWMKNCLIPLDIVFVLNDRISRIHSDCEPCEGDCNKRYSGIGDHIIEFPAGVAKEWKVGDRVKMYLGTPQNPVR